MFSLTKFLSGNFNEKSTKKNIIKNPLHGQETKIDESAMDLHSAVKSGKIDKVRECLGKGVNVDVIDPAIRNPEYNQISPLLNAIEHSQADIAALLVKHGASLTLNKNIMSCTPVEFAVERGQVDCVASIWKACQELGKPLPKINLNILLIKAEVFQLGVGVSNLLPYLNPAEQLMAAEFTIEKIFWEDAKANSRKVVDMDSANRDRKIYWDRYRPLLLDLLSKYVVTDKIFKHIQPESYQAPLKTLLTEIAKVKPPKEALETAINDALARFKPQASASPNDVYLDPNLLEGVIFSGGSKCKFNIDDDSGIDVVTFPTPQP